MALSHLKLLIALARIDGVMGEKEEKYILNIGSANGLDPGVVQPLFRNHHPLIVPDNLTSDQKFNYIFSLVQLMKIDQRLYKEEMLFCSRIAARLGYSETVMFDLMLHVKSVMGDNEKEELKKLTTKYLSK